MYKIINVLKGAVIATISSEHEVLEMWAQKCSPKPGTLDFSNLNVTGKDSCWNIDGPTTWPLCMAWTMKPYRVLDGARSVDIRNWTEAIASFKCPEPNRLSESQLTGSKRRKHRLTEPSFRRQTLRERTQMKPEMKRRIRHPNRVPSVVGRDLDCYRSISRSWKDQTKSRRQWAKDITGRATKQSSRRSKCVLRSADSSWRSFLAEQASNGLLISAVE